MFKILFIFIMTSFLAFSETADVRNKIYSEKTLSTTPLEIIVTYNTFSIALPRVDIPEIDNALNCSVLEIDPHHGLPIAPVYSVVITAENTEGSCFIFIRHPDTGKLLNIVKYGD